MNQSIAVLPTSKQQQSPLRDCPSYAQASTFPLLTDVTFESEQDATRFLKLPHPRTGASISPCLAWTMLHKQQLLMLNMFHISTGAPALFLPASKASEDGGNVQILLEVQAVNATGDKQRSWFTSDDKVIGGAYLHIHLCNDWTVLLMCLLSRSRRKNATLDTFRSCLSSCSDPACSRSKSQGRPRVYITYTIKNCPAEYLYGLHSKTANHAFLFRTMTFSSRQAPSFVFLAQVHKLQTVLNVNQENLLLLVTVQPRMKLLLLY